MPKNKACKVQEMRSGPSKNMALLRLWAPDYKSKKFISSLGQLFDIAGCQCADLLHCKCEKNMKVPHREHEFLTDQRTGRHMKIGGVDIKTSQMI